MNRAEQDSRGRKDWVGKQFGNLTVAAYDGRRGGKHYWRCLCKCGKEAIVCQSNLKSSHTRSCGCLSDPRLEEAAQARKKAEAIFDDFLERTRYK